MVREGPWKCRIKMPGAQVVTEATANNLSGNFAENDLAEKNIPKLSGLFVVTDNYKNLHFHNRKAMISVR